MGVEVGDVRAALFFFSFILSLQGGRYYGNGKFQFRVFITVYYGLLQILRSCIMYITGLF